MKIVIQYLMISLAILAFSSASYGASINCASVNSGSEKISDVLKKFRVLGYPLVSETTEGKIYKAIKDKNDDVGDLSSFCTALQGHNEVEAYFVAIDRLSSLSGPAAPFIKEQLKMGRFILDKAGDIAEGIGLQALSVDYWHMGLSINIDRERKYWFTDASLKPSEMRKLIKNVSLVRRNNTSATNLLDAGVFLHRTNYEMRSDGKVYNQMTGEALTDEKVKSFTKTYEPSQQSLGYTTGAGYLNPSNDVVFLKVDFINANTVLIPVSSEYMTVTANEVNVRFIKHLDGSYGFTK